MECIHVLLTGVSGCWWCSDIVTCRDECIDDFSVIRWYADDCVCCNFIDHHYISGDSLLNIFQGESRLGLDQVDPSGSVEASKPWWPSTRLSLGLYD